MKYRTLGASRSGLITPSLPTLNTTGGIPQIEDGQYQHWATAGFFGRLNYDYKGRYLLEVNARYDGTSRFMREKRWNLFPSRSEEHTSELQSLMRLSYAVFCLNKQNNISSN